jgi:glutamate-1-semialdehyde 2,1-aminomutase
MTSSITGRQTAASHDLLQRSAELFPGGVNSPVRAFRGVGGEPFVVKRGKGSRIWDVDDNEYIDYVLSWGPLVLGHAPPSVLEALERVMQDGTSFGIPTALELELAELVVARMPHIEMLRFVSSGTEATMSAIRLARAATSRDAIIKFDGCYHGHGDSFLVRAGSGVATLGLPNSPGVPSALASMTLTAFLAGLRKLCDASGALLIFDEVMTGFRIAYGGARERFGVTPDLTTLGKVIGGGLPVAAYGGRRDLMAMIAPSGPVYQAGTLSGNPLAMAAGIATLKSLTREVHDDITRRTTELVQGLRTIAASHGVPLIADSAGSMFGFFFRREPVRSFAEAKEADTTLFARFFHAALDRGVYLAPSAFEAGFVSAAHSEADIAATLERLDVALETAKNA